MNRSEVANIIDGDTSGNFDAWVTRLLAYLPEDPTSGDNDLHEEDFNDVPF